MKACLEDYDVLQLDDSTLVTDQEFFSTLLENNPSILLYTSHVICNDNFPTLLHSGFALFVKTVRTREIVFSLQR
jgi:hypothetical protein